MNFNHWKCEMRSKTWLAFFVIPFYSHTFSKLCKKRIQCHVEECSVALFFN
jgi:hypothetical protein